MIVEGAQNSEGILYIPIGRVKTSDIDTTGWGIWFAKRT